MTNQDITDIVQLIAKSLFKKGKKNIKEPEYTTLYGNQQYLIKVEQEKPNC